LGLWHLRQSLAASGVLTLTAVRLELPLGQHDGSLDEWRRVMDQSGELFEKMSAAGLREAAPYAVVMAYRVRFYMEMNAREAMHVIELRTGPQGHPSYRRICQLMHTAIGEHAGHHGIGRGGGNTRRARLGDHRKSGCRAGETSQHPIPDG
jgi:hypothetical protein